MWFRGDHTSYIKGMSTFGYNVWLFTSNSTFFFVIHDIMFVFCLQQMVRWEVWRHAMCRPIRAQHTVRVSALMIGRRVMWPSGCSESACSDTWNCLLRSVSMDRHYCSWTAPGWRYELLQYPQCSYDLYSRFWQGKQNLKLKDAYQYWEKDDFAGLDMSSVWTTSAYHSKHCTGRYQDTKEDQVDQEWTRGA